LQVLEDVMERTRREGGTMLLAGVAEQPLKAMDQSGFLDKLGRENAMPDTDAALARAREILESQPTRTTGPLNRR
jgi:SulP family sulfate permease